MGGWERGGDEEEGDLLISSAKGISKAGSSNNLETWLVGLAEIFQIFGFVLSSKSKML